MVLRLMELGWGLVLRVFGQRDGRSVRQCASRRIGQLGIWCIEVLLLFPAHTASLLLCWLVVSKRQLDRLVIRRKSMKFGSFDGFLPLRNESLRLQFFQQLSVDPRRTAVGLAPLGYTSNGW